MRLSRPRAAISSAITAFLAAACGLPPGQLNPDPWPKQPTTWTYVMRPESVHREEGALVAYEGSLAYEASRVLPGVIRVRVAKEKFDPRPSIAVLPGLRPDVAASDGELEAALREATALLQFSDGTTWRWFARLDSDEEIVGLGERPHTMHQRGRRAVMWNTDNFSYEPDAARLYQSIPFWISLNDGRARGFFVDNTHRLGFDIGAKHDVRFELDAEDGDFDVYLIEGPTPRDVVTRFAELTGKPPMPPAWALGYQQCRWSYETQQRVLEVARGFRQARVPCDVLYTDIDYMLGFRSFTVDPFAFPDFTGMVHELRSMGMRVVSIIDPGLKVDPAWEIYREGKARGFFVKNESGDDYVGTVWPGDAVFPDFTRADVREWWGGLYRPLVEAGVAGFWNDMNEPSVFDGPDKTMPESNVHDGLGGGTHARFHNAYGALMARATREGIEKLRPEARAFVLTRAGYAGTQRDAATWTGDNRAKWSEVLRSIAMTLNFGMSGQPFAGPDIGGFNTGMENGGAAFSDVTPELYARWLEFGALLPIARSHTIKGSMAREPFAYGEPWTSVNRASIERRYRLMPLLYTLAEEAHRTGAPIARPLLWIAPSDAAAVATEDTFLLGDSVMVAPVVSPSVERRTVYFPEGTWWRFDPQSPEPDGAAGAAPVIGPRRVAVEAPFGKIPLFARGGAVVPCGPVMQFVGEKPLDPLTLEVFAGTGQGELYEDAGDGHGYARGEHARTRYRTRRDGGATVLSIAVREGAFAIPKRRVVVRFHEADGVHESSFDDDGSARELRSDRR